MRTTPSPASVKPATLRMSELEHVLPVGDQVSPVIAAGALGRLVTDGNGEGHGMAPARTRTTEALSAASDAELGSAAQRDRRKRILVATLALASKGGYEAVQMRTVAERADVALGTLYRYFPSKIHLLVSGLAREFERTQERLDRRPIPGETPYDRMLYVLGRITRSMQREPMLTEAMTRAFMFADPSAAAKVNTVARLMEHMLTRAMHEGEPTA